ncbi:hypothetical protein CBR_g36636 [Chara braunii]|uniref:Uncharacterized protein n=1 Tax=Chara braunii TaxID=69332 RepID=A0A388LL49_CHABU|nr:hypothetical protein CBR_g36636 [Chara braunii]|eukprot:GBG83017.1 hypothetical protein CBR_g36636 [Chara braunii]
MSGSFSAVRSANLGFDRVREGKKVVVASAGKERRAQYLADMKKELMKEYKADLEVLCRKDNIKYVNKKQVVNELVELRAQEAYGEKDDDQDEDLLNADATESQEENPYQELVECLVHNVESVASDELVLKDWHDKLDGLVVASIDHNIGDSLVCCMSVYHNALANMYWRNEGFQIIPLQEGDILDTCKRRFDRINRGAIAPWNPKGDGIIAGTPLERQPTSNHLYAPSAPPLPSSTSIVPVPSVAAPTPRSRSSSPSPLASNAIVPFQLRPVSQYSGGGGWNSQPRNPGNGEIAALLRELVNSDREKRERKREEEDRNAREEQIAKAKEEETARLESEEKKEKDRETRMGKMFAEQIATLEKKTEEDAGFKRDPAKGKDKDRSNDSDAKTKDGTCKIGDVDSKKRGQDALQGGSPVAPDADRQKTHAEVVMGKKVVVASAGKERRAQYLADMKKELMKEYKADLEVLCRKDNIKYVNKKQVVNELVELRAQEAYGEKDDDQDEDLLNADATESQEENPS